MKNRTALEKWKVAVPCQGPALRTCDRARHEDRTPEHAPAFIRATGAAEQPIAFINNDLPGVVLAGAAECYLARYGAHVST